MKKAGQKNNWLANIPADNLWVREDESERIFGAMDTFVEGLKKHFG